MFLLAEAVCIGLDNISDGLVVYPNRIAARVQEELPFMATESVSSSAFHAVTLPPGLVSLREPNTYTESNCRSS